MDDPLSAVDAHVGRALFENVICGVLKGKVRILVTHQLQYLPHVDHIVVLKDGEVAEHGSFEELLKADGGFRALADSHGVSSEQYVPVDVDSESKSDKISAYQSNEGRASRQGSDACLSDVSIGSDLGELSDPAFVEDKGSDVHDNKTTGRLVEKEVRAIGSVKVDVMKTYFRSFSKMPGAFAMVLFFFGFTSASRIGTDWWLSYWSDSADKHSTGFFIGIYGGWTVFSMLLFLVTAVAFAVGALRAATMLHRGLLQAVLRAPMSFFDTTPSGRTMSRFSKDMDLADQQLRESMESMLRCLFSVAATFVLVSVVTPWFILILLPVSIVYYRIMNYYRCTSRELKRLDSLSKSPIFSHFTETLLGLPVIRAFGNSEQFALENERRLNKNLGAFFMSVSANRWLALRLDITGSVLIFSAACLLLVVRNNTAAGLIGLALVHISQVMGILNWAVRQVSQTEMHLNAVERLLEYQGDDFAQEAAAVVEDKRPPDTWPESGMIEFDKYSMRYRQGLDLVLRGVSFRVEGGTKLGICGRTGSGKVG